MHAKRLCGILVLGLGLTLALLAGLHTAQAAPAADDWFVTPTGGGDCSSQATPCTLQAALGLIANGDTIYVAEGIYTGTGSAVIAVTKSITLYGGWDGLAGALVVDPDIYPTTLDGEGVRQVVYISGNITPTLAGFIVTGGNASVASGGGIYVITATVTISGCQIHDNTAAQNGGGISLNRITRATLAGNRVYNNTAGWSGGGISLSSDGDNAELTSNDVFSNTANSGGGINVDSSDNARLAGNRVFSNTTRLSDGGGIKFYKSNNAAVTGNQIYSNTAVTDGGGVSLDSSSAATLTNNIIMSNVTLSNTTGRGGGIYLTGSPAATLIGNQVSYNTAAQNGGGMFIIGSNSVALTSNQVLSNVAALNGGGLFLWGSSSARLAGNLVYCNQVTGGGNGGGIFITSSINDTLVNNMIVENILHDGFGHGMIIANNTRAHLLHTTLAGSSGGDERGIHVSGGTILWMTNTIVVRYSTGIYAASGNTVTLNSTLWGSGVWANLYNWSGPGSITSTQNYTGNPAFMNPSGGDYHLGPGSAAIDRGILTWAATDIDGDPRVFGALPDLGADEARWLYVHLPLVLRNY